MTKAIFSLPDDRPGSDLQFPPRNGFPRAGRPRNLVPLLAVEEVSGGFFSIADVKAIVANPERFAHGEPTAVVSAYRVRPDRTLIYLTPDTMFGEGDLLADLGLEVEAGIVVDADALARVYQHSRDAEVRDGKLAPRDAVAAWQWDAPLPERYEAAIRKALREIYPAAPRKASKTDKLSVLRSAMRRVIDAAHEEGVEVNPESLPPTKAQWLALLQRIDPTAAMEPSTFDTEYQAELGWVFEKKSKKTDAELERITDIIKRRVLQRGE